MIRKLIFVTMISASSLSFAQGERMDEFLTLELGLDETRAAQVKQIFEDARDSAFQMKKEHRTQMQAHREATKAQLAEILTEEEMEKLEEKRGKKMKHKRFKEERFENGE